MPRDKAQAATGICSSGECSGRGRSIVQRSIDSKKRRSTPSISHRTAEQICDAFILNYLRKLPRRSSERNIHYNGTIQSARQMCTYDVVTMGVSVGYWKIVECSKHRRSSRLHLPYSICWWLKRQQVACRLRMRFIPASARDKLLLRHKWWNQFVKRINRLLDIVLGEWFAFRFFI